MSLEIIAEKKRWTYSLIIFVLLFGFLLFLAGVAGFFNAETSVATSVITLLFGGVFFSISFLGLIFKLLTPKVLIQYDEQTDEFLVTIRNKKITMKLAEIRFVQVMYRQAGVQFAIEGRKRTIAIWGISRPWKVVDRINGFLDSKK